MKVLLGIGLPLQNEGELALGLGSTIGAHVARNHMLGSGFVFKANLGNSVLLGALESFQVRV